MNTDVVFVTVPTNNNVQITDVELTDIFVCWESGLHFSNIRFVNIARARRAVCIKHVTA